MKINLRKAAKFRSIIEDAIKTFPIPNTASVMITAEQPMVSISEAEKLAQGELDKVVRLETILFNLRSAIGEANSGRINTMITRRAHLLRLRAVFAKMADAEEFNADRFMARFRLAKDRAATATTTYRQSDDVSSGVFAKATIDGFKQKLVGVKREITDLDDRINDANMKTEIEFADSDFEYLQNLRIL
jgi:hypothetical protein